MSSSPSICPACHEPLSVVTPSGAWKLAVVLVVAFAMPLGFMMLLTGPAAPVNVLLASIAVASGLGPIIERCRTPPHCRSCGKVLA
ncbi:MAG: hypothetical protein B7733_14445 [Myxococcales bacterium FL481]|nr:MAG: hypothetical protein B7733_14445 [Myxococcales bacterium FL481]